MVTLGDEVKDKITGFKGIAIARTEWLYNCVRIVVQPQALHEGKPIEDRVFDEEQLTVVKKHKFKSPVFDRAQKAFDAVHAATGGDQVVRELRHKNIEKR